MDSLWVESVGTLYHAGGAVIGCCYSAYVRGSNLGPGETGFFEITFPLREYADVASYRLQVDGRTR